MRTWDTWIYWVLGKDIGLTWWCCTPAQTFQWLPINNRVESRILLWPARPLRIWPLAAILQLYLLLLSFSLCLVQLQYHPCLFSNIPSMCQPWVFAFILPSAQNTFPSDMCMTEISPFPGRSSWIPLLKLQPCQSLPTSLPWFTFLHSTFYYLS